MFSSEQFYIDYIKDHPDNSEAHFQLGSIFDIQGKVDEAEKEYKAAINIKPKFAFAYCSLGLLYHKQGKHAESISEYKKAINAEPHYAEYLKSSMFTEYLKDSGLLENTPQSTERSLDEATTQSTEGTHDEMLLQVAVLPLIAIAEAEAFFAG